jgi:hypothetical protein
VRSATLQLWLAVVSASGKRTLPLDDRHWARRAGIPAGNFGGRVVCCFDANDDHEAARLDYARPPDPQGPLGAHVRYRLLVEGYRFILTKTLAMMRGV